jgi:hypothetical protein
MKGSGRLPGGLPVRAPGSLGRFAAAVTGQLPPRAPAACPPAPAATPAPHWAQRARRLAPAAVRPPTLPCRRPPATSNPAAGIRPPGPRGTCCKLTVAWLWPCSAVVYYTSNRCRGTPKGKFSSGPRHRPVAELPQKRPAALGSHQAAAIASVLRGRSGGGRALFIALCPATGGRGARVTRCQAAGKLKLKVWAAAPCGQAQSASAERDRGRDRRQPRGAATWVSSVKGVYRRRRLLIRTRGSDVRRARARALAGP